MAEDNRSVPAAVAEEDVRREARRLEEQRERRRRTLFRISYATVAAPVAVALLVTIYMTWPGNELALPCAPVLHEQADGRGVSSFRWSGASEDGRYASLVLWAGDEQEYSVGYEADSRSTARRQHQLPTPVEQVAWCRAGDSLYVERDGEAVELTWKTFTEKCDGTGETSLQWEVCSTGDQPRCARPTDFCADEDVELVDLFTARDVLWVVAERHAFLRTPRFAGGASGVFLSQR